MVAALDPKLLDGCGPIAIILWHVHNSPRAGQGHVVISLFGGIQWPTVSSASWLQQSAWLSWEGPFTRSDSWRADKRRHQPRPNG